MKKAINILVLLVITITASAQSATLVLDTTKLRQDTVKAERFVYLDSATNKIEVLKPGEGYWIRQVGPLVYKSSTGGPDGQTGRIGVHSSAYYLSKGKRIGDQWIILFIKKQ